MGFAGHYHLQVFCDGMRDEAALSISGSCNASGGAVRVEVTAVNRSIAFTLVRQKGWVFKRDGRALCRRCSKADRKAASQRSMMKRDERRP